MSPRFRLAIGVSVCVLMALGVSVGASALQTESQSPDAADGSPGKPKVMGLVGMNFLLGYHHPAFAVLDADMDGFEIGFSFNGMPLFLHGGPIHFGVRIDASATAIYGGDWVQAQAIIGLDAVFAFGPLDPLFPYIFGGGTINEYGIQPFNKEEAIAEHGGGYRAGGGMLFKVGSSSSGATLIGPEFSGGQVFLESVRYSFFRGLFVCAITFT